MISGGDQALPGGPLALARVGITRRRILRGLLCVTGTAVATSLIAACSGQPGPTTQASPAASKAGATLRVWGYGLDDARAKARIAEFKKANPSVDVQAVGGSLDTQQLLTSVASGDPPEVVSVDRFQTGSWAGRNAIDPLDDLISRDKFDLEQFYPFTISQVKYKSQVYGVPQFVNLDLLYLGSDVLQQTGVDPSTVDPGNWEQLQQLGEKLAQKSGDKVTRTGFDTKVQDGRL